MFAQHVIFNVRQKVRSKLLNYLHPHSQIYTTYVCACVLSVLARNAIDFSYPLTLHQLQAKLLKPLQLNRYFTWVFIRLATRAKHSRRLITSAAVQAKYKNKGKKQPQVLFVFALSCDLEPQWVLSIYACTCSHTHTRSTIEISLQIISQNDNPKMFWFMALPELKFAVVHQHITNCSVTRKLHPHPTSFGVDSQANGNVFLYCL